MNRKKKVIMSFTPTSTGMNNAKESIHHLASSNISSPRDVAPLSPRQISASVSLLDAVWRNLRIPLSLNLYFRSNDNFLWANWASTATPGLHTNQHRDTRKKILADNEEINGVLRANNYGQQPYFHIPLTLQWLLSCFNWIFQKYKYKKLHFSTFYEGGSGNRLDCFWLHLSKEVMVIGE